MAGEYGLVVVVNPADALVDIVFVHGITGNRRKTWTHSNGTFWPEQLLPQDIPGARVLTFGYDADLVGTLRPVGQGRLRDHASALALDLAHTLVPGRPVVFVAHSMGGLPVEQMLTICYNERDQSYRRITESTAGIMFLGTPHAGTEKATWWSFLKKLAGIFLPINKEVGKVLKPGSEVLFNVQQSFHGMLNHYVRSV
ncbi:hypothetical protein LTR85_001367 [Meristemomyces frigidus]|nr:hypothetical protein LTR85_001367 [Meristemomyces frigidus]